MFLLILSQDLDEFQCDLDLMDVGIMLLMINRSASWSKTNLDPNSVPRRSATLTQE